MSFSLASLNLGRYSKSIAAVVAAITEGINIGLIPHSAQNYVSVGVSILTVLGVYGLTNTPLPTAVHAIGDVILTKLVAVEEMLQRFMGSGSVPPELAAAAAPDPPA